VSDHVHRIHRPLLEQRKEPDRPFAIRPATVAAPATREGDGIGAVGVRLLGQEEKRVLTGAGQDGRADEGEPAGREDRGRREAAGKTLAGAEQAEAM
jgi:hypothetical protein